MLKQIIPTEDTQMACITKVGGVQEGLVKVARNSRIHSHKKLVTYVSDFRKLPILAYFIAKSVKCLYNNKNV
jgi:hypothetical protein